MSRTGWLVLVAVACLIVAAAATVYAVERPSASDPESPYGTRYMLVVDRYEHGVDRYLVDTWQGRVWWWPNAAKPKEGFVPIPVTSSTDR